MVAERLIPSWYEGFIEDVERRFEAAEWGWTGFEDLDALLGPWEPPMLMAVRGPSGVGRTAFLLSLALNVARAGHGVTFIGAAPMHVVRDRLVAQLSRVPLARIRDGRLEDRHWAALGRVGARAPARLTLLEAEPHANVSRGWLRDAVDGDLVMVDGLRHPRGPTRLLRDARALSRATRGVVVIDLGERRDDGMGRRGRKTRARRALQSAPTDGGTESVRSLRHRRPLPGSRLARREQPEPAPGAWGPPWRRRPSSRWHPEHRSHRPVAGMTHSQPFG